MAEKKMAEKKAEVKANVTVFGTRPENSIFVPELPYPVRADCGVGMFKVGNDDYRGKAMRMSIVHAAMMFGRLGKATTNFLQIWFIPAPNDLLNPPLPKDTLCCMYIKTQSIRAFYTKVTELMNKIDPGNGVFEAGFEKHANADGETYYSVVWEWEERKTDEEWAQLELIAGFLAGEPTFFDGSNNLARIQGLDSEQVERVKAEYLLTYPDTSKSRIGSGDDRNGRHEQPKLAASSQSE